MRHDLMLISRRAAWPALGGGTHRQLDKVGDERSCDDAHESAQHSIVDLQPRSTAQLGVCDYDSCWSAEGDNRNAPGGNAVPAQWVAIPPKLLCQAKIVTSLIASLYPWLEACA